MNIRSSITLLLFLIVGGINATSHVTLENPYLLVKSLTLRQKIAQLCIIATISHEEKNQEIFERWQRWQPLYNLHTSYAQELIETHGVGGVIFYGKHTLPAEQKALTLAMQSKAAIPLFIAMDAESGLSNWFEEGSILRYPQFMALGATADEKLVFDLAREHGEQLSALEVNMCFSPVVDVNNNPNNPVIGIRSFGGNVNLVKTMASAYIQGLQTTGVIACAKHFPGHGDTDTDSHTALPLISFDRERLDSLELAPYPDVIEAGVKSIMIAHLEVPALENKKGLPSTLSRAIVTDLLKNELGFEGLIITDALGMMGAANFAEPGELEVRALEAGCDILLCPVDPVKAIDAIERAVSQGRITEKTINEKVLKVLRAKKFACCKSTVSAAKINDVLKSAKAQELQREAYAKTITVVGMPPHYYQALGEMKTCLISFSNEPTFVQDLTAFDKVTVPFQSKIRERVLLPKLDYYDRIVITIHSPFWWSYATLRPPVGLESLILALKKIKKHITVVVFGSPYYATLFNDVDAVIIAYEDTPQAQTAVQDVLLGKRLATGKLPV